MQQVAIVEFPSNLGLKEPSPGHEPGVRKLPSWLKQHGFHDKINPAVVYTLVAPVYTMNMDEESGVRNAAEIVQYSIKESALLNQILVREYFPLVLGGDCSILIGSMLALKERGNYGLFYLDGHHDFMLPSLSSTGGAAGMDLAIVTGYGHEKLTNINNARPYVQEDCVWSVGNREYDQEYVDPILNSTIHYLDLPALRSKGMASCANEFLEMVNSKKLDGFWIHLDVDVLDDALMPAVDSRTSDGLSYDELESLLCILLPHPKATGIEITILDPELDPDGRYTNQFVERFCTIFNVALK